MVPRRRRPGLAHRGEALPVWSLTLSALAHAAVLAGLWGLGGFLSQSSKVYVVNLVPSISAVGSPQGGPARPSSRQVAKKRVAPVRTTTPVPKELPASPKAPDSSRSELRLPSRPVALPEPEVKEPSVSPPTTTPVPKELPVSPRSPEFSRSEPPRRPSRPVALGEAGEKESSSPDVSRSRPRLPGRPVALPKPGAKEQTPIADSKEGRPAVTAALPRPAPAAEPVPAPEPRPVTPAIPPGHPSGSSQGTASLSLDVSDFPHAWYLRQILQKVEDSWTRQAKVAEPEEKPLVYVEIQRNGSIRPPKIEKGSGNVFYDQAALRAIIEASPFPPLPEEWPRPSLRVLFRFELRPERG